LLGYPNPNPNPNSDVTTQPSNSVAATEKKRNKYQQTNNEKLKEAVEYWDINRGR
jgi:hypothetical protein